MNARSGKRYLSFLLALVMIVSMVPVQAFAAETAHDHTEEGHEELLSIAVTALPDKIEYIQGEELDVTGGMLALNYGDGHAHEAAMANDMVSGYDASVIGVQTLTVTYEGLTVTFDVTVAAAASEPVETTAPSAADTTTPDTTEETDPVEVTDPEVNPAIAEIQAQIDDILIWYLGSTKKTQEEIENIVANEMTSDEVWVAQVEFADLEAAMIESLTEEECQTVVENNPTARDFYQMLNKYSTGVNMLANGNFTVANGNITMAYSGSSTSDIGQKKSETAARFQAYASGLWGGSTNTITVTNSSDKNAVISFTYSVSGDCNAFKIAGNSQSTSGSGSYTSVELESGASFTIAITGRGGFSSGEEVQLDLTAITWTEVIPNPKVTLVADAAFGSITVGGTAVASGTIQEVATGGSIALGISKNSNAIFLGWVDVDGKVLSTAESYTLAPIADMTVRAAFAKDGGTPWFGVGSTTQKEYKKTFILATTNQFYYYTVTPAYLFDDLNKAIEATASGQAIVLMNSGTLPAGTYTIPSGRTLLIPFDSSNTLYKTGAASTGTYTTPTAYRTLTMADGANLVINGALSISGQHKYCTGGTPHAGGVPVGPTGFVQMNAGSNITVNSGGALYSYGFITGDGSVTANSGATVYELFQVMDFRGGSQTTDIKNGVFPLSQYYVQNIEVPMTLYAGAMEYSFTTIYMSSAEFGSSVGFIGNSGMFNISSGYVIKDYDESTDRLKIEAHGAMAMSPITMAVGGNDMDTADYELPINSNLTVRICNGSSITLKQDVALLPGSQILVEAGATCTVAKGVSIYVYDADEWGGYVAPENVKLLPVSYAPGRKYTRTAADLVDATIMVNGTVDASEAYVYTTAGGANIYSTGGGVAYINPGSETVTYQVVQASDPANSAYPEIPLTPAKLKNADGSYTSTIDNATYTYDSVYSVWHKNCTMEVSEAVTTAATCTKEGVKTTACSCGAVSMTESIPTIAHTPGNEATCTTPQLCTVCNTPVAPAKGHTMVETVAKEATCQEAGTKGYFTCSVCSGIYKDKDGTTTTTVAAERIDIVAHNQETVLPAVAATCTTAGKTEGYACSFCGETQVMQTTIPALGHDGVAVPAVAPTCETTGLTEGVKCQRCGVFTTPQQEVAALGHKWDAGVVTKAANCFEEGSRLFTCQNDASHTKTEVIEKREHNLVTYDAKEATCTEDGYKAYEKCMHSDCTYTTYEAVEATGHSYTSKVTKDATCTADGVITYTCSKCNDSYTETIDALGHNSDVTIAAIEPTCTLGGKTEGKSCSRCGTVTVAPQIVPATGHTEEEIPAVEPTCTATGLTAGVKCSVCGTTITAQEIVPAKGHSYDTGVVTKQPTCTETGVKTFTCSVCDDSYTEEVDKIPHTLTQVEAKAATCTEKGWEAYEYCAECNYTTYKEIAAKGHNMADYDGLAATCTADGYTDYKMCAVCGHKEGYEVLGALGHDHKAVVTAPTCEDGGYTTYTCSRCSDSYQSDPVDPLGHDYTSAVTKAPTCTEAGVRTYTCQNDAAHTYTEAIEATGHTLTQVEAKAPTCTAIGWAAYEYCSVCSYTTYQELPKLSHDYQAVVTPATCEAQGYTTHTCTGCGDSYVDSYTAAIGHKYVPVVTKAATCTEAGVRTYTCANDASHTYTEEIAAKGHTKIQVEAKAPTCTAIGWDAYEYCSVCDYTTYKESPATGHSYQAVVTAPTCTEDGYTTHTCSKCGDTYVDSAVEATGHTEQVLPAVAATCTVNGLTEGKKCSVCGTVLVPQGVIEAPGHDYESVVTAPTCTEAGYTTHTCSVCDDTYTDSEVQAVGHDYEAAVTAPTCTEAGYTTYTCSVCDDTYTDDEVEATGHTAGTAATCTTAQSCTVCGEELAAALGHAIVPHAAQEASCEDIGWDAYETCSRCDYTTYVEIPAIGHSYTSDTTKEADCLNAGEMTYTCSECGDTYTAEIPALGHAMEYNAEQAATCTKDGVYAGGECTRCDYTEGKGVIPALGHDWVEKERVEASCTEDGEILFVCSRADCDEPGVTETEVISAPGHTLTQVEAKAVTCTEIGWNAYEYCSVCDHTTYVEIPAAGHNHVGTVTAPTCTADGYTTYICSVCGDTYVADEVDALGHDYQAVVTAPTCTTDGYTTHTCSRCGDTYTDSKVDKLNHIEIIDEAVAATCTTSGLTEGKHCSRCGIVLVKQNVISKLGHTTVVDKAVEATCIASGLTEGEHCSTCGEVLKAQQTVEALGHDTTTHEAKAATCTAIGWEAYETCSRCNYTTYQEQPALGHDKTVHEAKEATCTEIGWDAYETCSRCSYTTYQEEPALGHNTTTHEAKAATCTAIGWEAYETCSRCDYTTYVEIPAKGHTLTQVAAKAADCENIGWNTYEYCSVCGYTTYEELPATGHAKVQVAAQAAGCENIGWDAYEYCSKCDYTTYVEIPAKGHTLTQVAAKAADCENIGWNAYEYCSVCNYTTYEEIPAKGHSIVSHEAKAPTCTEVGWDAYETCENCDHSTYKEKAKLGHDYQAHEAQAATCTAAGWKAYVTCSRCDYSTYEQIPATGHTLTQVEAQAATCTEIGWNAYEYCSVCDYTTYVEIPAKGHTLTQVEAKAATCEAIGWNAYEYCSVCSYSTYVEIPATGHTKVQVAAQAAGCENIGWDAYEYCSKCDYTTYVEIPAKGHKLTQVAAKAADCENIGWNAYEYCSVCNYTTYEEIPAKGHSIVSHEAKAPTCTEVGWDAYETCENCDHSTYKEKAKLGHDYQAHEAQAATCTAAGWKAYVTCSRCDYSTYEQIPATGHTLTQVEAQAATCTEIGWNAYEYCSVCEYTTYVEIPAKGHTLTQVEAKAATCEAIGWNDYEYCSVCSYTTYVEIPAKGHDEIAHAAKAATCVDIGWGAYITCSRCDYTTYVEIPATGHSLTQVEAKAATCEAIGWEAYEYCTKCDHTTYQELPIQDHNYVQVVTAPTCLEAGYTTHTCSGCGDSYVDSETEALGHDMAPATCTAPSTCKNGCGLTEGKALGHTVVKDEDRMALCEDEGLTEGSHCSVCGEILVAQEAIPALGHDIIQYEAKKATFTGAGWEAYEACSRCAYSTKVEIPALGAPTIEDYETFLTNLALLENMAAEYVKKNPGKDPAALVIKYIRTGVDRYNSGSWGIMAGSEDTDFAAYVAETEDAHNSAAADDAQLLMVSGLKNIENFTLPNGDLADIGHVFGMMDITYHNNFSLNHTDVAGWAGDTVDLLSLADQFGVSGTLDEMVADITENYLLKASFPEEPVEGTFSLTDMYGDLDGYYIMKQVEAQEYENGTLTAIFRGYFTEDLNDVDRADYFLKNRLNGVTLRGDVRDAIYNAYTGNKMVTTLEGTRVFNSTDLATLKKACCYAVADYLCRLAGDYVEATGNSYYDVFSSESSTLAPGITQDIKYAYTVDGKQIVYYLATADLTRDDVSIYANYNNNDPSAGWAMQRVLDQANAAQDKYGDPESEYYIENYNVIASINGAGYNMSTGEPGGLLVMNGVEYHAINANGFFGILKDGTPVIGTTEEYNTIYKDLVQEGIAGFGSTLVKDGEICISASGDYYDNRASRTAIGITRSGKVVFMVLDGRQEPWSCGGSMEEIAQIMLEAGCVHAINLDGGGSSTYVAKQEGEEELAVINRPSDGAPRSVSTSLIMVSTAASSTAFDHAILDADTSYMTVGSSLQVVAEGVSATGNAAELPEGTTWAVSDGLYASITEDGVITALENGDVDVYLMLGDQVIGTKTIHVVIPNNVYFTKSKIDVIYGETAQLPVKLLYDGKAVTALASDLVFVLDNPEAGVIDGFNFISSTESTVRSTRITASLAADESISASITIALYNQGEASFDFDQATGGDRQLAWDRKVSNSTTDDQITYQIIDPDEDMVTSYIFAIDMTQIPIPQRLEDLIYMLPGADMEGASAWNFLLQLAQRVSVLTEVRPTIHFDPNFEIDYSEVTLVNEYFELKETILDEQTNTLTLILKWKKQTQAIDPAEANPMCILSGIKLTPKADAEWTERDTLTAVHSGEVGYDIYLRASSLYTFAQKPENQETYGLLPYQNPDDSSDAGASFGDIYKEFEDTYTLARTLKNGWYNEDGGFVYYIDGVRYTGIKQVDGYYYDFGENGVNIGQTKYTGLFWDAEMEAYRYSQIGVLSHGWKSINGEWYHFWQDNLCASVGTHDWGDVNYTFEQTGRLTSGVWKEMDGGTRYYYGPTYYQKTWATIGGEEYYFDSNGYRAENYQIVKDSWTNPNQMYHFTGDGALIEKLTSTGLLDTGDGVYYLIDGIAQYGLYYIDGYYYYFNSSLKAVTGTYYVNQTNGLMAQGEYRFDEQGRMILAPKDGLVQEDDGLYYYENGVRTYAGLIEIDGDFYYINSKCKAVTGKYYVNKNNGMMPQNDYLFGDDSKMIIPDGLLQIYGEYYYYKNGVQTYAGLIKLNGYYYYINSKCKAVTGKYYVNKNNGLMPQKDYYFDEYGRMLITGLVEEDGELYYYENGIPTYAGLIKIDGYYYYINSKCKAVTGAYYINKTNGIMAQSNRDFDENCRMILNGLVEENGGLYYYKDGKLYYAGLIKINGYYYYINSKCKAVSGIYYVNKTNDLLPQAEYEFGEDCRMIVPGSETPEVKNGIVTEDGAMYYYVDGIRVYAGLIELDGYYYYVNSKYKVVTGTYYVFKTNGLMPQADYQFADDGRMILPGETPEETPDETPEETPDETPEETPEEEPEVKNGIVTEDGVMYYYVNGVKTYAGLIQIDGDYYYVNSKYKVVTGTYYVSKTNGLMSQAEYTFAEDGKLIGPVVYS